METKSRRTKSREESPPTALPTENKLLLAGQYGSKTVRQEEGVNPNLSFMWKANLDAGARKSQGNFCKKTGHFARVCRRKTVNRIQKEKETGSNNEPWPEVDHIQSVNGVNRIDG